MPLYLKCVFYKVRVLNPQLQTGACVAASPAVEQASVAFSVFAATPLFAVVKMGCMVDAVWGILPESHHTPLSTEGLSSMKLVPGA